MSADIKDLTMLRIGAMQHLLEYGYARYSFTASMVKGKAWVMPMCVHTTYVNVHDALNNISADNDFSLTIQNFFWSKTVMN